MLPPRFQLSCGKSVKYKFIEFFVLTVVPFLIYFLCFSGRELHSLDKIYLVEIVDESN